MTEAELEAAVSAESAGRGGGPPPLSPFGLVLRRDGSWRHDGHPILNRRLRERFDRSVVYLVEDAAYVVRIGHFRGLIEIEETGFFVRGVDPVDGSIALSDGTVETLEVGSLVPSELDGAFLCRIKRDLVPAGVLARFSHAAQAELLARVEAVEGSLSVRFGRRSEALPAALLDEPAD